MDHVRPINKYYEHSKSAGAVTAAYGQFAYGCSQTRTASSRTRTVSARVRMVPACVPDGIRKVHARVLAIP